MSKWRVGGFVIVAACSSSGENPLDPVDAPVPVDAGPDARACHLNIDYRDRGDVRVELVHRADGTAAARATAFVYADPGGIDLFPFASLGGCTDVTTGMYWPTATNPMAERTYYDPGDVVISGGPNTLSVPRQTSQGFDVMGREHPAGAWFAHDAGPTADDGAQYLTPGARLDVAFSGSANLPAQVLEDVLYLPPTFELLSPSIAPLSIPSSDITFTFTAPEVSPPLDTVVLESVVFSGPQGPVVMCTDMLDGSVTVPQNFIDIVRAKLPDGGTLIRQSSTTTAPTLDGVPDESNGCPIVPTVFSTAANVYESPFTIAP